MLIGNAPSFGTQPRLSVEQLKSAIDFVKDCVDPSFGKIRFLEGQKGNKQQNSDKAQAYVKQGFEALLQLVSMDGQASQRAQGVKNALIDQNSGPNTPCFNLVNGNFEDFQFVAQALKGLILSPQMVNDAPIEHKVELMWTAMVFSTYIRDLINQGKGVNSKEKLQAIKAFDEQTRDCLGRYITDINEGYAQDESLNHKRHVHQKILQIQANLFHYAKTVYPWSPKDNKLAPSFVKFPCEFNSILLKQARDKAQGARSSTGSPTERAVIEALAMKMREYGNLRTTPTNQPIDWELGLELDFPLTSKVTVEVDGESFHMMHGAYAPDHVFKAHILKECGWIRIPVNVNDHGNHLKDATSVAKGLSLEIVQDYIEQYQQLMTVRAEVRRRINELRKACQQHGEQIWQDVFPQLKSLMFIERKITPFIATRKIDRVLGSHAQEQAKAYLLGIENYDQELQSKITHEQSNLAQFQEKLLAIEDEVSRAQETFEQEKEQIILELEKYTKPRAAWKAKNDKNKRDPRYNKDPKFTQAYTEWYRKEYRPNFDGLNKKIEELESRLASLKENYQRQLSWLIHTKQAGLLKKEEAAKGRFSNYLSQLEKLYQESGTKFVQFLELENLQTCLREVQVKLQGCDVAYQAVIARAQALVMMPAVMFSQCAATGLTENIGMRPTSTQMRSGVMVVNPEAEDGQPDATGSQHLALLSLLGSGNSARGETARSSFQVKRKSSNPEILETLDDTQSAEDTKKKRKKKKSPHIE